MKKKSNPFHFKKTLITGDMFILFALENAADTSVSHIFSKLSQWFYKTALKFQEKWSIYLQGDVLQHRQTDKETNGQMLKQTDKRMDRQVNGQKEELRNR